jgi:F0F1-type ATP synthase membrane subunit b/b'
MLPVYSDARLYAVAMFFICLLLAIIAMHALTKLRKETARAAHLADQLRSAEQKQRVLAKLNQELERRSASVFDAEAEANPVREATTAGALTVRSEVSAEAERRLALVDVRSRDLEDPRIPSAEARVLSMRLRRSLRGGPS